ncbi:MAG: polysaccharide deacetylase family protein [Verrucomicrobia bacterium]|nr:polysaccharide deacetylase family protein [Verrucomicrobiota bacterium]
MYHHVAPVEAVPPGWEANEGWRFMHTPEGFSRQLLELRRRGYRFISLAELVDDIHKRGAEDPKTVAVTFDDGWLDNFIFGLPVLKELSVSATFFVTSGHLHRGKDDAEKMNTAQLQEMLRAGMTIGGHTRTHPDLTKLLPEQARDEIVGCKEDLEGALGVPVQFFAYPGGAFNRSVARLTQEAGYVAACSVLGPARNDQSSLFWLYRDLLSESMNTHHDRYRLSPIARRLLSFRVRRRLSRILAAN